MSKRNTRDRDNDQHRTEMRTIEMSRVFSGPLPPPESLARYNQILPGAAERIIAMAEKQQEHRQDIERRVVLSNTSSQARGPYLGFILALIVVIGGMCLIHEGKQITGLATVITTLATLAGVFVYGRISQKTELAKKKEPL